MNGKIITNISILLLVLGFVGFAVWKVASSPEELGGEVNASSGVAQMKKATEKSIGAEAVAAAAENGTLYVATANSVVVFRGAEVAATHKVEAGVRNIAVRGGKIYLVYKAHVEVTDTMLNHVRTIAACSDNSEFCAVAVVSSSIYVSDAESKNLVKYAADGSFRAFITSPNRFIVPSLIFDLAAKGDTLIAVNPGRHSIEFYTAEGNFIRSFKGDFRGCCNPAFIAVDVCGNIVASEKGEQRISTYTTDGQPLSVLAEARMLNPRSSTVKGAAIAPMGNTLALALGKKVMWLAPTNNPCNGCKQSCPQRK
jgi:hypothetical protein